MYHYLFSRLIPAFFICLLLTPVSNAQIIRCDGCQNTDSRVENSGYIKLDLNVDSVKLNIDNDFDNIRYYQNGDSIALSPGQHYFVLTWPFDEPAQYYHTLTEGKTTVLVHRFNKDREITGIVLDRNYAASDYFGSNLILQTDPDSEIWYKDNPVGKGFISLNAERGKQQFEIRNPDFGNRSITIDNRTDRISYHSLYTRPEKKFILLLSPLPGAAQLLKRQKKKALTIIGSALVSGGLLAFADRRYNNEVSKLNTIRSQYVGASTVERAERLGSQMEDQISVVDRSSLYRNLSLIPVISVLAWNLYDAFFSEPNGGYRKKIPLRAYIETNSVSGNLYPTVNLSISR
ncbi:hypothetical protein AB2B38_003650 [Balneola sp. MJW-20]|uniref:hypothetical protein n=1 Tax=Gracilimonas aurantiaca TaxID=3234185 RepID=UPI0034674235